MTLLQRMVCIPLCLALLGAAGCSGGSSESDEARRTTETFDDSVKEPRDPVQPPPPMLNRDPKVAVYSYLLWITYAYRILDSDVATMAFSPYEEVRINSYVQYNKQEGRAIDQHLLKIDFKEPVITKDTTATVAASEKWKYRYISTKTGKYNSPWYETSYETTYTLVRDTSKKKWLVNSVEAKAKGEVK